MKFTKKALASKVNSVRPYKSRSKRPCDFCRRRKTCCIIEKSIPCLACQQFNKGNCTFVAGPLKRSRKAGEKQDLPAEETPLLSGYSMEYPVAQKQEKKDTPTAYPPPSEPSVASLDQSPLGSVSSVPQLGGAALESALDAQRLENTGFQVPEPLLASNMVPANGANGMGQLYQSSPLTPSYNFRHSWPLAEANSNSYNTPPGAANTLLPSERQQRQSMSSNSSSLSNMSTVSALSMGNGALQYGSYGNYGVPGFPGGSYTGYNATGFDELGTPFSGGSSAWWGDASDYDAFVMESMPEELRKEYMCSVQAPNAFAGPVQALGYEEGDFDALVPSSIDKAIE